MQSAVPVMTNACILLCETCFSIKAVASGGRIASGSAWLSLCNLLQTVLTCHPGTVICIGKVLDTTGGVGQAASFVPPYTTPSCWQEMRERQ